MKPIDLIIKLSLDVNQAHTLMDFFIDMWHQMDTEQTLHDFIGITEGEYFSYVKDSGNLSRIILQVFSRKNTQ